MAGLPPTISDNSVTLTFGAAGVYYGYCTVADVTFEFPDLSLFTTLTNSVVAQEVTYAAQEMQEQLATVYQMPYAGADGGILLRLRELNAKLAVANLVDRYYRGSEENVMAAGAAARSFAELLLKDVLDGVIQWAPPFGDAVPVAERPLYPRSAGATIRPSPTDQDWMTANPIFTTGRNRFRGDGLV